MTTVTLPSGTISMSDIYGGLKLSATEFNARGGINSRAARTLVNIRSGTISMGAFRGAVVSGTMAFAQNGNNFGASISGTVVGNITGTIFAAPALLVSLLYNIVSGNSVLKIHTGGAAPSTLLTFSMSHPTAGWISANLGSPVSSGGGDWDYTFAGDGFKLVAQSGLETFWRIS